MQKAKSVRLGAMRTWGKARGWGGGRQGRQVTSWVVGQKSLGLGWELSSFCLQTDISSHVEYHAASHTHTLPH